MYFSLGMGLLIALSLQWFGYVSPVFILCKEKFTILHILVPNLYYVTFLFASSKISLYISFAFRNVSIIYLGISIYPTWGLLSSGLKGTMSSQYNIFHL